MDFQVFTDTVEDNDGTVDRITYNRQQSCNEGGIKLHMEEGEIAQGYQYVDNQSDNRCQSKAEFKADGDISNHQEPGKHNRHNSLLNQLAADGSTNVFNTLDSKVTNLALQVGHYLLTLLVADNAGTNQHALRALGIAVAAFQLDNSIAQILFFKHLTYLRNGNRIFEFQIHDTAAGKVNAQVKALEKHGADTDNQEGDGNSEENFITLNDRELHYLATSSFAFGAFAPNRKGLLVMLL